MIAWPHQDRCVDTLAPMIHAGGKRVVASAPTGAGKSYCMRRLCELGVTSAVYTHRRMLLDQMAEGLAKDGIRFGFIAADREPDINAPVQLCMVQTVARKLESPVFDVPRVQVVHDDECHADKGERKRDILARHADHGATLVGWTATPVELGHLYDNLFVFATNSELRGCGAHVPADTYAPSEIDMSSLKSDPDMLGDYTYANETQRKAIFGEVLKHYRALNPGETPTLLFAPGVKESVWFAQHFTANGHRAAHIDGERIWLDGKELPSNEENREMVKSGVVGGAIKVLSNRFVMREGVDIPELQHGILATPFVSLAAYLQGGGRFLRAHPSHDRVVIQDHGGNYYLHGSLNSDREWDIQKTDAQMVKERVESMRKANEPGEDSIEPIVCPKCMKCRASGPVCPQCGHRYSQKSRRVLQSNGELKLMYGDIYAPRKVSMDPHEIKVWKSCYFAAKNSKRGQTFAQAEAQFKHKTGSYPDRSWPLMPRSESDRFLPVRDVPFSELHGDPNYTPKAKAPAEPALFGGSK